MISTLLAAAALAGGFQHPVPTPPADLPASVYRERRERVMKALEGCIGVIGAQGEVSGITEDYRQDGNFYWLTGINEPGAFLVFAPKSPFNKVTLFLKPRDPEAERWTGPRDPISPDLKERYGVDRVRRGSPDSTLEGAGENHECVAIIAPPTMAKEDRNDAELATRVAQRFGLRVVHKRALLAGLREVHSSDEVERMERAIAITRLGHEAIAKGSVAGVSERDLQTQMEYAFFAAGATGLSYSSIVGSGPNGAVLHWDKNTRLLKDGDLVVVDAADVMFAVDSIPAVFGVTTDLFIVLTSNIFAILGLRSLFFLIAALVQKLRFLKLGVAVILGFIGAKILLDRFYRIPIAVSLAVLAGILIVTTVASLLFPRKS